MATSKRARPIPGFRRSREENEPEAANEHGAGAARGAAGAPPAGARACRAIGGTRDLSQPAPAAPNIASVYHRKLHLKDQLFLAISQSGKSEDLVESTAMARAAGALTAALVNTPESPLAAACDIVLPIGAGAE